MGQISASPERMETLAKAKRVATNRRLMLLISVLRCQCPLKSYDNTNTTSTCTHTDALRVYTTYVNMQFLMHVALYLQICVHTANKDHDSGPLLQALLTSSAPWASIVVAVVTGSAVRDTSC